MAKLVVLVTTHIEKSLALAEAWQKAGAPGVTLVPSHGFRTLKERTRKLELPHFVNLSTLLKQVDDTTQMLFSVVDDPLVEALVAGDADGPGRSAHGEDRHRLRHRRGSRVRDGAVDVGVRRPASARRTDRIGRFHTCDARHRAAESAKVAMLYWRSLMDLLTSIGFSIIVAAVLAFLARRLNQPLILGYILAGAVLGPHVGFHVVTDEASIELIAEIGLILLLFLIGLEISLPRLLQAGRAITVTGLLQVPICAGLAWLALGPVVASTGGQFDRLYLSFAGALSSTLIVVKLLSDKFELSTFGGRVTLGVLIFQDLYAIAFLAIQPNLQNLQAMLLLRSLVAGVGLVGGAWVMARFVLPAYFRVIAKSSELVVVSAMAWCFLVAGVAGWAGLSKEMGALIAGVVIASYPYGTEVISRVGGVRDFFLTLFFVALGPQDPGAVRCPPCSRRSAASCSSS